MEAENNSTQAADSANQPSVNEGFDVNKIYKISVPHPDFPEGRKEGRFRFPSDKEWCERAKKLVTVRKSLDRQSSKTDTPADSEAAKTLLDKIKIEGPEFDEFESLKIIERMASIEVLPDESEKEGMEYRITLSTFNRKIVTHRFKIPTQKQLMELGRSAVQVTNRRQSSEMRVLLEPSLTFWKAVSIGCTGYVDNQHPPVIHMDAAINELLLQIQNETEDGFDPED